RRRWRQSYYASAKEAFCRRAKAANANSPASIIRRTTMPLDRAQAWHSGARHRGLRSPAQMGQRRRAKRQNGGGVIPLAHRIEEMPAATTAGNKRDREEWS